MKGFWKKALAATLALSLVIVPVEIRQTTEVKAEQLGSLATEVTGTWSYWDGEMSLKNISEHTRQEENSNGDLIK